MLFQKRTIRNNIIMKVPVECVPKAVSLKGHLLHN